MSQSTTPISSGSVYTTRKMARFWAMCAQTPVGTLLFYKATSPATGLACALPHFQSLALRSDQPFTPSLSVQYYRLIVYPNHWRFSVPESGPHNKCNKMICLTNRCACCVLRQPTLSFGDKRDNTASAAQNHVWAVLNSNYAFVICQCLRSCNPQAIHTLWC